MVIQRRYNYHSTVRTKMVEDTRRWLDWALERAGELPRIPRVRVDSGIRFSERFKVAFWSSVFLRMSGLAEPLEED
ncbi:MAG TPA: hypothetical protein VMX57_05875 [Planctomycetota bacterium]|nr:hypothetical protein [Planctomycetota bacterium]